MNTERQFTIPYLAKSIEACSASPSTGVDPETGIILTHGAGGDMNLRQLVLLTQYLVDNGFLVMRFTCKGLNLAYRVKVYTEVLKFIKDNFPELKHCFIGGRSMGSRAAVGTFSNIKGTRLENFVQGIICISYPLHTKDNKSTLRDAPLYAVTAPICFISGTNDKMCDKATLGEVLQSVVNSQVKWMDDADHGLKVKGVGEPDVVSEFGKFIVDWCKACSTPSGKARSAASERKECSDLLTRQVKKRTQLKPLKNGKPVRASKRKRSDN